MAPGCFPKPSTGLCRGTDRQRVWQQAQFAGRAADGAPRQGRLGQGRRDPDRKVPFAIQNEATAKTQETHKGRPLTRILELDVATKAYGTRQPKYAFEEAGNVPADFQMLTATTGLLIERDDATEGSGTVCRDTPRTDCFTRPARFKRIYKIDMDQTDADGFVKKVAFIDLTKIANPRRLSAITKRDSDIPN